MILNSRNKFTIIITLILLVTIMIDSIYLKSKSNNTSGNQKNITVNTSNKENNQVSAD